MAKEKVVFFCTDCGNEYPKWQGKCSCCGSWNTIAERPKAAAKKAAGGAAAYSLLSAAEAKQLDEIDDSCEIRFDTGMKELDRVLGGGAVLGSLVLIGGAPGIGKSTLLLQICGHLCEGLRVLYVSGEESQRQLKMRAERLGVNSENLYVLSETGLETLLSAADRLAPNVLIVDSIQTLSTGETDSAPGSISQVKLCTMELMRLAKSRNITIFVIGHVNKDGAIAGPKVLEHMVDCVLNFEGDSRMSYRILRAAKNRFGSTNEIGVFDMRESGLVEVPNPSAMLLSGRPKGAPGSCVSCIMEGTLPVLAELQALLTTTNFGVPRRNATGFDYNRAMLLMAVLEKRGGLSIGNCDAYINVVGGLTIDEPAADLPMLLALASSFRDVPVPEDLVAIGEAGLAGELRGVAFLQNRINEVHRLGFRKCIIPKQNSEGLKIPDGLHVFRVSTVREALEVAMS